MTSCQALLSQQMLSKAGTLELDARINTLRVQEKLRYGHILHFLTFSQFFTIDVSQYTVLGLFFVL